jgi:hypothetical protein
MIHGIFVTTASASAGEIDVLQFVPSVGSTSDFIVVGTYKFNQATTFYIPIKTIRVWRHSILFPLKKLTQDTLLLLLVMHYFSGSVCNDR